MVRRSFWRSHSLAAGGLLLSLLILLAIWCVRKYFPAPPQTKKLAQQITVIQLPPPPPPVEKPPEPEIQETVVEQPELAPEPEQEPDPAPEAADQAESQDLGLDAEGSAGADAFGLLGNKGGRSLLGGTPGSTFLWYGGQIRRRIEDSLQSLLQDTPAGKAGYSVAVEIWIDASGQVSRVELAGGSGQSDVDQALRTALPKIQANIGKPPPNTMPQPVRIRINSRI